MAYSNIGTPRIFVSTLLWLKSHGLMNAYDVMPFGQGSASDIIEINPSKQSKFMLETGGSPSIRVAQYQIGRGIKWKDIMPNGSNFSMWLGHNFGGTLPILTKAYQEGYEELTTHELVNYSEMIPQYNGYSISYWSDAHDVTGSSIGFYLGTNDHPFNSGETNHLDVEFTLGSYLYGTFYQFPHSPELKLTMSRDMDGVKKIRTRGGSDLVKYQYTKSPLWGSAAPWELYEPNNIPENQNLARSGRRTWSLTFNYLQDSDVFPGVSSLSNFGAAGYSEGEDITANTLLIDDTFFSTIHKTNGGQLPFVFQPDSSNFNDLAICKFDMKSFKFNQVANGIYNINCKIKEVW